MRFDGKPSVRSLNPAFASNTSYFICEAPLIFKTTYVFDHTVRKGYIKAPVGEFKFPSVALEICEIRRQWTDDTWLVQVHERDFWLEREIRPKCRVTAH